MLKVAKAYGTNLAAICLSPSVRSALPAWYHPGAAPRPLTNVNAKCMLKNHGAKTVTDLIKMSNKIRQCRQDETHVASPIYICMECVQDRRNGCRNLQACAEEAVRRLDDIAPKYNPLTLKHHDETLSLTPNRKAKNREARRTEDGEVTFDPSITCKDGIAECFRVFTDPTRLSMNLAIRQQQRGRNLTYLEMKVYTDRSCENNGKLNAESGSGVWIEANHPLNIALKNEGPKQSNQVGELVAVIAAVGTLPNYCKLTIITDSRYIIEGLTEHLQKWEDNGWIEIENAPLFKQAAYLLKKRSAPTAFEWVKGHRGVLGNEESDKLAKEGAGKEIGDAISTHIPVEFDLQGAKLATLTQAVAYKGIRERKTVQPCQTMAENLDLTRNAIATYTEESETNETVTNQGIGPRQTDTETLVTRETSAGRAPLVPFRCRTGRTAGNSRGHSLVQSPGMWERIQPSMGKLYHNGMIR